MSTWFLQAMGRERLSSNGKLDKMGPIHRCWILDQHLALISGPFLPHRFSFQDTFLGI